MPHKRNPIVSEAIVANTKLVRGLVPVMLDLMVQEHERDMRPWLAERGVILIDNVLWSGRVVSGADDADTKAIIAKVNREDLWRQAAKAIGVADKDMPTGTSRGKETFFDGKVFDPADPKAYLASLQIKKVA